jgi:hypothetical protein
LLEEHANCAVINAVFSGTIVSQTTGYNGPVTLDRQLLTPVRASKQIVLDGEGIRLSPTSATARTTSRTTDIRARSKGVRGRITERFAWKKANKTQAQADAIASQHAAERIQTTFDEEVQKVVALMEKVLIVGLPRLSRIAGENGPPSVRFRSTPGCMELVLRRPQAGPNADEIAPPPIDGDPQIAVRAHRSVVLQALAAGDLQQMLGPLLAGTLDSANQGNPRKNSYRFTWSADGNWLTLLGGAPVSRTPAPTIVRF